MNHTDLTYALENRAGLPEPLRVLLEQFPRDQWEAHGNFGELVKFWLSRHVMFREVLDRLQSELNAVLWSQADFEGYRSRLSRLGGFFLQQLHGHHTIEDQHYFPQLIGLEPNLDRGFTILDADHHALDALLHGFADTANTVLKSTDGHRENLGALDGELARLHRCLDRHLNDEEELIVPIILKSGFTG